MKIEGNKVTADTGKELYNIADPEIYGGIIHLGINDSVDNWHERNETIIEVGEEEPEL